MVYLRGWFWKYKWEKARDKFLMWVAWRMPKSLVMWCYVRVGAHATTGQYNNTLVGDLKMMDALDRWD